MKQKLRIFLPHIVLVTIIIASGGACGKKDTGVPASGSAAADSAPVSVDPGITIDPGTGGSVPPVTNPNSAVAANISGHYRGKLYINSNQYNGYADVTVICDNALNVSLSVSSGSMNPPMTFVATALSAVGAIIYYNYPYAGSAGEISSHNVWINSMTIDYSNPTIPKLNLQIKAVATNGGSFGPWDIFTWQTYQTESSNWIHIDSLVKISN